MNFIFWILFFNWRQHIFSFYSFKIFQVFSLTDYLQNNLFQLSKWGFSRIDMLVIKDGFSCSVSFPTCVSSSTTTLSIIRADLVWNFVFLKGSGSVPFLQALENCNSPISNWMSKDLYWIDSDQSNKKWENGMKEGTEEWDCSNKAA